jgi:hypothetical protein
MSASQIAQQTLSDVQLFASGVSKLLPIVSTLTGIQPAEVVSITTLINQIDTAAAGISSTITTTAAQPIIAQIGGYFNELLVLLPVLGVVLPPPIPEIIAAAKVLLPYIETAVGMLVAVSATPGAMSVEQARTVLAGG